jgi:1-hydroxycarotenoid 3,4-desaturase
MVGQEQDKKVRRKIIVIGAGIGGLSSALKLAHAGHDVHVIDSASGPGGKMRTHPGSTGPIDIGPTVLTLLPVFERLFRSVGEDINDHVKLAREPILARHWWPDGTMLDLHENFEASHAEIQNVFGVAIGKEFEKFYHDTRALFECFDLPVMQNARPNLRQMMSAVFKKPQLIPKMRPFSTLESSLSSYFKDPRLQQLFGRYASYIGGAPQTTPALLSLIWQAEAKGVWTIKGGMNQLARAIEKLCIARGAEFTYNKAVVELRRSRDEIDTVVLENGSLIYADAVIFNGDPRAMPMGKLGNDVRHIAQNTNSEKRSLSAYVWGFDARIDAANLAHHNVFFADRPNSEFDAIQKGEMPTDPTIYICAQDRGINKPTPHVDRLEIILNAPPLSKRAPKPEDFDTCKAITFDRLQRFGLTFQRELCREHLTMPEDFARLFPASDGSLYGQSPEGMMATLKRPQCVTQIKNLFLVGGGIHPGAGVPMAALCGQLAVEEMTRRQILT